MKTQIIEKDGQPEWAIIPYDLYLHFIDQIEHAEFQEDSQRLKNVRAKKNSEFVPLEVVDRIIDGENAVRVWRKYRGLKQQQLADRAGISKAYLSQIESNKRIGTIETLATLAKVLNLTIDDLIR